MIPHRYLLIVLWMKEQCINAKPNNPSDEPKYEYYQQERQNCPTTIFLKHKYTSILYKLAKLKPYVSGLSFAHTDVD